MFQPETNSIKIYFNDGYAKDITHFRIIQVKKLRYIWLEEKMKFMRLIGLGPGMKNSELHQHLQHNPKSQMNMKKLYGNNEIIVGVQSYLALFLIEISSPYYVFQLFSMVVWILDDYLYYTYAIIAITIFGIGFTIIQTHSAQVKLKKTVQASDPVRAKKISPDGGIEDTLCLNLVPGDKIVIPDNEEYTVPCDAVILSGSCIVQESMLTGESVPLTKTSLPSTEDIYKEKESTNHMLYSGTKVIQTRRDGDSPVIALVLRTGYITAKGELVRAILYPPPVDYEFEQSIYTFINISAVVAFFISTGMAIWLILQKQFALRVFIRSFELLTMVVPAAIPGALALCKAYSIQRFRKQEIACINSKVINVAGATNCVCFDKTGTITEDGLDVWGIVPVDKGIFLEPNNSPSTLPNDKFKFSLASCHSLSICNGKMLGDPLDVKMFHSIDWIFEESIIDYISGSHSSSIVYPNHVAKEKLSISLLHQNQFLSSLQRMSVIAKCNQSESFDIFCKGSPEMIASLSQPSSVPINMDDILLIYTKKGYRVLALGWREVEQIPLDILKNKSRSEIENNLQFLGLLILENKVKSASKPSIDILKKGQFKITMITGDNLQTAISVSRECQIISSDQKLYEIDYLNGKFICTIIKPEFCSDQRDTTKVEEGVSERPYMLAVTGKAWEVIRQKHGDVIPKILVRTSLFARMTSKQKQQVVTDLQTLGYCVVMCGDGANDCAALKAANVGVSLSQAEASVASPLSSAKEDITCVPIVIKEGRASLVASFGLIKLLLCYGYIQLFTCIVSYTNFSNLSDFQYIWEDIFIIMPLSIFYALTNSYEGDIVIYTPVTKMLNFIPICSIAVHMVIYIAFQFLSYYWIQQFPWYIPNLNHQTSPQFQNYYSYKNYVLFSSAISQILISSIIFSQGYPYRKPLYSNYLYLLTLSILVVCSGVLVSNPGKWIQELFVLALPPIEYRYIVLTLAAVNFFISFIVEKYFFEYILCRRLYNISWNGRRNEKEYHRIQRETSDTSWISKIVDQD